VDHTVVDEEGLVAAGHHVAGLAVGSVSDLCVALPSACVRRSLVPQPAKFASTSRSKVYLRDQGKSYLGHSSLSLEASADTVVDTLGLAP